MFNSCSTLESKKYHSRLDDFLRIGFRMFFLDPSYLEEPLLELGDAVGVGVA